MGMPKRRNRSSIEAGADPNDAQTLYNRMFSRDDEHLRFLFAHGMGEEMDRP